MNRGMEGKVEGWIKEPKTIVTGCLSRYFFQPPVEGANALSKIN